MHKQIDNDQFLKIIFEHILQISKGDCTIEYDDIALMEECQPDRASILQGLKFLHEDLSLYKANLKQKLENEYKLKVLEKKNQELEQFNYIASHDLKEPLRTIKNFSDLIIKRYSDNLDEKGNEFLGYISQSSDRMYKLIDSLLNFSQVDNLKEKVEFNCNHIIQNILKDLNTAIEENNATVNFDNMPIIIGNKTAYTQLFINLIANAIKYKSPDRDPLIMISHSVVKGNNIFSVSDNGIGIDLKYQDQIFELFSRLHNQSEIKGSGIGLSTCRKIIESSNGKIWLESEIGKGSTFYFSIPV